MEKIPSPNQKFSDVSSPSLIDKTVNASNLICDLPPFKSQQDNDENCINRSIDEPIVADIGILNQTTCITERSVGQPAKQTVPGHSDGLMSVLSCSQSTVSNSRDISATKISKSVISNSIDLSAGESVSASEIINVLNHSNNQYQIINVPESQNLQYDVITDMNFWYLTLNQLEGIGLTPDRIKALLRDGPSNIPSETEMPAIIDLCKSKITGVGWAKEFSKSLFGVLFRLGDVYEKNSSGKGAKNRTAFDPKRMTIIREAVQSHYGP